MKTAILLYEPNQLASLDALMARLGDGDNSPQIVSLDAEIDYELEERGIPFVSGSILQNRTAPAAFLRASDLTDEICKNETLASFKYLGVPLMKPVRFSIQLYFANLLYYIDVISRFVDKTPDLELIVVPAPTKSVSKTSSFLAEKGVYVVVDAAHEVAKSREISFEMAPSMSFSMRLSHKLSESLFTCKRVLFGWGLSIMNLFLSLRSRRDIRIIASDYWRNISPTLRELPESELFLIDRTEALKAGLKNIWRYNIRFVHIEHFLLWRDSRKALHYAQKCLEEWLAVRARALDPAKFLFCGVSLAPVCEQTATRLAKLAFPRVACDIAGAYSMYERLNPDAVLVRASVSEQIHFAVLPLVAKEKGIPALEVQHGGEYLGPGSSTHDHPAHFIATYGPLVCDEFRDLGYSEDRPIPVGSPRFDAYKEGAKKAIAGKKNSNPLTVLSNTPSANVGERFGTYSTEEYFKALGEAVRTIPDAQLKVTSRANYPPHSFNAQARERGLKEVKYESVGTTPLPELFLQSDVFVCSYSTIVYEALLYRMPVILAAFAPVEKMMADSHFGRFEKMGALRIAHSPKELSELLQKLSANPEARARMRAAGWEFMEQNFSFDGRASERIAALIRNWSKRTTV